ncbi:ComF family protein [Kangiella sediminilitoris]|uniref:Competence protein F n=1 Tax=Kangiella sediminilitoris TaxID=1144748 RepID=A0A1B3B8T3_9GAMM|nr:ComF family protein [Kangiella sediminilitoris]AOE49180.1 Competence protein F [Kangiella sediminilitoris]
MSFFHKLSKPLKAVLALSHCSFCGSPHTSTGICDPCQDAVSLKDSSCHRCASPINTQSDLDSYCGRCQKKPPPFDRVITASRYQFPVDKALGELKFNNQLHYARSLAHLLQKQIKSSYTTSSLPEAIVAIPLHTKRLNSRGFNQSELIAQHLEKALQIPRQKALVRVKDTPHQVGLSEKQRRKNLTNAFKLQQPLPRKIALIDDVVTTGSTVSEAARLCLKHGVQSVDVWCLAKT